MHRSLSGGAKRTQDGGPKEQTVFDVNSLQNGKESIPTAQAVCGSMNVPVVFKKSVINHSNPYTDINHRGPKPAIPDVTRRQAGATAFVQSEIK